MGHNQAYPAEKAETDTQINETINRLTKSYDDVAALVSNLAERIQPVLNPVPPAVGVAKGQVPQPVLCPLSERIDRVSDRLCSTRDELHALLGRMAL